jgi:hypothetical protein
VPTLLLICILIDHVTVSADIAEFKFLMIHVGSLGPTSSNNVATSSTSPKSTSSNLVQLVQPPPPTVIDLTVESIEDLKMANVQEQKAALDNEMSGSKDKVT